MKEIVKRVILGMGMMGVMIGMKAQDAGAELKAIEAAYSGLEGVSADVEMKLYELRGNGEVRSENTEATVGEMVWTPGGRYEELDGVERWMDAEYVVMADRSDKQVLAQAADPGLRASPFPVNVQPLESLARVAEKVELLSAAEGMNRIRFVFGSGDYASVTLWYKTADPIVTKMEMVTRAANGEPAMLLVAEMKNVVKNAAGATEAVNTGRVVMKKGDGVVLTGKYAGYRLVE